MGTRGFALCLKRRRSRTTLKAFGETVAAIAFCNGVGGGTAVLAGSGDTPWYRELEKPDWTPSGKTIGAVWTALYTLMGVSLAILWRRRHDDPDAKPATGSSLRFSSC